MRKAPLTLISKVPRAGLADGGTDEPAKHGPGGTADEDEPDHRDVVHMIPFGFGIAARGRGRRAIARAAAVDGIDAHGGRQSAAMACFIPVRWAAGLDVGSCATFVSHPTPPEPIWTLCLQPGPPCAYWPVPGLKHGFDADHLATIDGLTRYNARANPRPAEGRRTLFSLGHGVILIVAWVAGTVSSGWHTPGWLEVTGVAVSTLFLFGLAFVNVHAVLNSPLRNAVVSRRVKGRLLGRVLTVRRPWAIAAVGMLFALSFDTVSLAALFALVGEPLRRLVPGPVRRGAVRVGMEHRLLLTMHSKLPSHSR